MNGAALATLVSLTLYNITKLLFIYIKLHIQPFTKNTLVLFLIFGGVFLLSHWIPAFTISSIPTKLNYLLTVVLKSIVCGSLFLVALLWTRTAPEINQAFSHYLGLLQNWWKPK